MRCYSHSLLFLYNIQGVCGLPESQDTPRALAYKLDRLVELVQKSNYTVALTGAGISTSAGIPDFRGPHGIWTKEQQERKMEKRQQKKKRKKSSMGENNDMQDKNSSSNDNATNSSSSNTRQYISFESAVPTYTHKALTHLILNPPTTTNNNDNINDNNNDQSSTSSTNNSINSNNRTYLHHIVTQNVDGLHHKTSLPRNKYSILHGCIFTEICDTCSTEYVRSYEIQSIGLQYTGRYCTQSSCVGVGGKLKDTLLDWEDPLPQVEWNTAQSVCSKADLILCLGTSLRIEPAGSLCTFTTTGNNNSNGFDDDDDEEGKEKRSKKRKKQSTTSTKRVHHKSTKKKLGYVIINLQPTPYDDGATLIIRAKVDDVMQFLMHKLGYTL
jgi:mono-ADP-ribosyltransferase sirtuin 6